MKFVFFICFLSVAKIYGQSPTINPTAVIIDAQNHLECNKDQKRCKAQGGIKIQKDTMTLSSEQMDVRFSQEKELKKVKAQGTVVFHNDTYDAQADKAIYTPKNQSLITKGHAIITDRMKKQTLSADTMSALFQNNEQNHINTPKDLKSAQAAGNVVFTTDKERILSQRALYLTHVNTISASGDVLVINKNGIIQAPQGTANLSKKIYTMEGKDLTKENQVSGVIFIENNAKKSS